MRASEQTPLLFAAASSSHSARGGGLLPSLIPFGGIQGYGAAGGDDSLDAGEGVSASEQRRSEPSSGYAAVIMRNSHPIEPVVAAA